MLGRCFASIVVLLLACASVHAHAWQPKTAHRGFAPSALIASRAFAIASVEYAKENLADPATTSIGRENNLRARYYDPSIGRFATMDSFRGFSMDPPSLHKYLYANADPIGNSDPSGRVATNTSEFGIAYDAGATVSLGGVVATTTRVMVGLLLAVGTAVIGGSNAQVASSSDLDRARNKLKNKVLAAAAVASLSQIIFHYTDRISAQAILYEQTIHASSEFTHPDGLLRPAGAYATWIPPWSPNYTLRSLGRELFAYPGARDLSWFVAIVKDGAWRQINAVEYVKPGIGAVPVAAVFAGPGLILP
jgi:RHS repeat-associated protein